MKNDFHGLISRMDTAEERISRLEDIINLILKQKNKEQYWKKTKQTIQGTWDNFNRCLTYICWGYQKQKERNRKSI